MRKLIQGIVDFRKNLREENRELFAQLALGQKPDALFIACSDSRVVPNLFASTNPGDLFVLRNIANLVPPATCSIQDNSASAILEFSIFTLKVANIIVCGHSECGGMLALLHGIDAHSCPHVEAWLQYGKPSLHKLNQGHTLNPSLLRHNQLSQLNVIQQIEHIKSYPFIQRLLREKKLQIHGWWFDIAHADVYCYEEKPHRFVLIDEE